MTYLQPPNQSLFPMNQPFIDLLSILNALPGKHLVLLPDTPRFTIVAATDDYLNATYTVRENLLGKGVFEAFPDDATNPHPTGVANLSASLHEVMRLKKPHQMDDQRYDIANPHTGGFELKVWKPVNKPVLNGEGTLTYIIHTVDDVTNTVQLVAITEANRYLQTIINLFREPLQVLQPIFDGDKIIDFRFQLVNQTYAAYANATPEQLQGKRVGDVFPGYFETLSFSNPVSTYQTGQPLTFDIHYNQDGLDLYNVMSTFRLGEEVIVHFTDVTRLKQLQLQLEGKVDELKRSNERLQQFAYVASHDLQEPLRKIQQFGDLLELGYAGQLGDGLDYLKRMQLSAGRMSTLISDLLSYSRITTRLPHTTQADLSAVVRTVLADLDITVSQTQAVLEVADLPTVPGDPSQLRQLFQNLIANALKFRQTGRDGVLAAPRIDIRWLPLTAAQLPPSVRPTRAAERYYRISVTDNGIGFEARHATRIFQVFERLHTRSQYEGTGVGLAICEQVVVNHGGAITATSQPGQGATFDVYLPA